MRRVEATPMTDHVRLTAVPRLRVRFAGETIVDTERAYVVHEGSMSARYYVPREDVRAEITDTTDGASCPWKGQWRHLDLTLGATRVPAAAWTYYATTPVCAPIQGFVAFYANKVEAIEVG